MQPLPLTKDILTPDLLSDVVVFLSSAPGAMFDAGTLRFITRDGTEYVFNYLSDTLTHTEVAAYFPPLGQCRFTAFGKASAVPDGWHHLYLGLGANLVAHGSVYPALRQQMDALSAHINPWSAWRLALQRALVAE